MLANLPPFSRVVAKSYNAVVLPASFDADTFNWYHVAGKKSQKTKFSRFSSELDMSDDTTVHRMSPRVYKMKMEMSTNIITAKFLRELYE